MEFMQIGYGRVLAPEHVVHLYSPANGRDGFASADRRDPRPPEHYLVAIRDIPCSLNSVLLSHST